MVTDLYSRLRELKVSIQLVNGKLDVKAPRGVLTPELIGEIREHKEELMESLSSNKKTNSEYTEIPKAPDAEDYPLSSAQERLWLVSQFDDANRAYNISGMHQFKGDMNFEAFAQSFNTLIERHENLRTVFRQNAGGEVRQVILPPSGSGFELRQVDVRNQPGQENWLKDAIYSGFTAAFDMARGPLLRAVLYRLTDEDWLFCYVLHHIISDAWSSDILMKELLVLYNHYLAGQPNPLPPLRIQYRDYSVWQRNQLENGALKAHREYWLNEFSGDLPVFNLPGSRPRPAMKTYHGGGVSLLVPEAPVTAAREICQKEGATMFMYVLAVVHVLLYRITRQPDIIIGTPIAGRSHNDLFDQIGFYINNLSFRCRLSDEESFHSLLQRTKKSTLDAYTHQVYPFDSLLEDLQLQRDMSRSPLVDVMVVLQNAGPSYSMQEQDIWLGNLKVGTYKGSQASVSVSKYDLIFTFYEVDTQLKADISFNSDIYTEEMVTRMVQHLNQLLSIIPAQLHTPVSKLDYLMPEEKRQVTELFNNTEAEYPRNAVIGHLFTRQALLTPDKIALKFGQTAFTYSELDAISNRMARYFIEQYGLQPDDLAGILLDRSDKLIIAILAILKAGAAYVPVDPEFPTARKELVVSDTGIKMLVTQTDFIFDLDFYTGPVFAIDVQTEYESFPDTAPETAVTAGNLAYIMFTSGSSGTPKGVMVEHRNVVRLVKNNSFINLTGSEVLLSTGAVSFDATTFEYWAMLLNGGTLVMCPKEDLLETGRMAEIMRQEGVDTIWCTAGWMHQLVDENIQLFAGLKTLLAGGDKLSPPHITRLRRAYPQLTIINGYGPTENTTFSLTHTIDEAGDNIPIGKPISNSTAYILDDNLQPAGIGIAGEICVGGDGLARGYLNQPGLTDEKFITNPFKPGQRLYKTGDLGRWLPGGLVEFMGRKDEQVKIRGYRIEPGEIEAALVNWPGVVAAVVTARTVAGNDKELVAYIQADGYVSVKDVSNYLGLNLPAYMVPAHIIMLEQMPLNANGKVDKRRLPAPEELNAGGGAEYVAPRNNTEARLADIWQEVLSREQVGVKDNFFELGGHSLKATRLVSFIHREFNVKIGLREIFASPVLEDQALLIDEAAKTDFENIPVAPQQESYPLSSSQKRLWVLSQFAEADVAYNMPAVYRLEGSLETEAFEKSLQALIERHENLRTVFKENAGGEVRQYIRKPAESGFRLHIQDARGLTKEEVEAAVGRHIMQPFNLGEGPLLRATLLRETDQDWVFAYDMHHIISDGWSMGVLIKELVTFYNVFTNRIENPLQPLRIQYKDFAVWQQHQLETDGMEQHRDYWLKQFSGNLPVLNLPYDFPRPPVKTFNGEHILATIDHRFAHDLKLISHQEGATLFMGVLAALGAFLSRYSGQDDLVIGTPIAGRHHADLNDQIGFYVNTLALRFRADETRSFRQLVNECRQLTLDAYAHQAYPFDSLVDELNLRRDMSRSALFDVMMVVQNAGTGAAVEVMTAIVDVADDFKLEDSDEGLEVKGYDGGAHAASKFDLMFTFKETHEGLMLGVEYNTDLFTRETAGRITGYFGQLLGAMLVMPDTPVIEFEMLQGDERVFITETCNQTATDYPRNATIAQVFAQQAAQTPGKPALTFEGRTLTYAELDAITNQLAHCIRSRVAVAADDVIAVQAGRSAKYIIAVLGVLKAGAAWLPLETGLPQARKQLMLTDAAARMIIVDAQVKDADAYGIPVLNIDDMAAFLHFPATPADTPAHAGSLAYIMYTSGSTGMPKGVMIEQRSVTRLVKNTNIINLTGDEVLLSTGAISFDATTFEYWSMLLNGGRLVMCSQETLLDADKLATLIKTEGVTMMWFTAGWLHQLVDEHIGVFAPLKTVLAGGDRLSAAHIARLKQAYPALTVINGYGPTENTTFSLTHIIDTVPENIPVGKPIANSTVYILDSRLRPVTMGTTGEIFVGGDGLARGYLNQPALTAEKFIQHPFRPGERLYRTGDLGRWLPGGLVEFNGRADEQVKIRGYRVEPAETAAALEQYPGVDAAFVAVLENSRQEKELVAWVAAKTAVEREALTGFLAGSLPYYMIPVHFVLLEKLPLNANGKVDRQQLPDPAGNSLQPAQTYVEPVTETEIKLAEIWRQILGCEKAGLKDNFFELGGHSLKATRLAGLIHKTFSVKPALNDLFLNPVLENQARMVDKAVKTVFEAIPVAEGQDSWPLSSAQRRLWVLSRFEEGSIAYNMPGVHELKGTLDETAFARSFDALVERHEILRTVFREDEAGQVRQFILPAAVSGCRLEVQDIRQEMDKETLLQLLMQEAFTRPFNLAQGPLVRGWLYRTGDEQWIFIYVMHHIISDGWSMGVLAKELLALYGNFAHGAADRLQPLRIQYKDYAVWQQQQMNTAAMQERRNYWMRQLAGQLPVLHLPGYQARPVVKTYNGGLAKLVFDARLTAALHQAANQQGATLFMTLLTGLNALLYCYTGQDDMIIGTPVAGRDHADLEGQIGFYINTLALRCAVTGADSFSSALEKNRRLAMDAFANQAYPFDELVDGLQLPRDTSRNALFDVMMVLQNATEPGTAPLAGTDAGGTGDGAGVRAKFDLLFSFTEAGDTIAAELEYNSDIYNHAFAEQLLRHLQQLLDAATASPATVLDDLEYLLPAEKQQLTDGFNQTSVTYPKHASVIDLFEQQAALTPGKTALEFEQYSFTYAQLNETANQLAYWLMEYRNIRPGDCVGILLDRGHQMILAIIAVLKAGGVYVPLDPSHPEDRTRYMTETAGCKCIISNALLWESGQQIESCGKLNPPLQTSGISPAYIMFTSGSTGHPKGVMVTHRGIVRLVKPGSFIGVTGNETLLATAAISFDVTTFEFWITLLNGGRLVLASNEVLLDAPRLAAEISSRGVDTMWFTAGWMHQLVDGHLYVFARLKTIIAGGDALSPAHIGKIQQAYPHIRLINGYGPTENTTFSAAHTISRITGSIPIGKPIDNSTIYIMHRNGRLAPAGVVGEIVAGGDGVALGYINRPEETARVFISSPFKTGERLYCTGDLGRWLPDGTVEFFGRKDGQVKIRGYRVETGEVETQLQNCAGVDMAAVTIITGAGGEKELAAYITGKAAPAVEALRKQLGERLPAYMIPAYFVYLDEMPLNENGKVNRKQLPLPGAGAGASAAVQYVAPRNDTEAAVAQIWSEVLGRGSVSVTANFFELGGNSIRAIKLQHLLKKRLGIHLKMKDIFNQPSVEQMAAGTASAGCMIRLNKAAAADNVFLVPPVLGNPAVFLPLAASMEGRYNCYGLQYSGLENDEAFFDSIAAAARAYYLEIIGVQEQGRPFVLLGYSMGVPIAFETAKLLEAAGWQPRLLLVDRGTAPETALQNNENLLRAQVAQLTVIYQTMLPGLDAGNERLRQFIENNLRMLIRYRVAGRVHHALTLVEATGNPAGTQMAQWLAYSARGGRVHTIEAGHWSLFDTAHLHHFEALVTGIFINEQQSKEHD